MGNKWDLRMQKSIDRWVDRGATKATALACSFDGHLVATGSEMGYVNIYSCNKLLSTTSTYNLMGSSFVRSVPPEKVITGLTTSIDTIKFSPDSKMMIVASKMKRDSLRAVQLPTAESF